jgi:hypothetical protein
MIEVEVTDYMRVKARAMAKHLGKLKNSITKGEGNVAGFIGELIALQYLGGVKANTYDFDIVSGGKTYDVKTKRCTSPPKPHYDCSVAAFNTKQRCDIYLFVRVQFEGDRPVKAWVLGQKDKAKYFKQARKLKKGEVDPSNNFKVKADCYNLSINKLERLEEKHV